MSAFVTAPTERVHVACDAFLLIRHQQVALAAGWLSVGRSRARSRWAPSSEHHRPLTHADAHLIASGAP